MANKSVNKVAVATKHPGVFMQTSELETETGQVLSTKAVDIDEKTEDFQLEKNETEVPEEIEFDEEEEEEMNLSDDQHVLPESDRIDETYDENEMKNGQIEENFDEKNDSLVCDESVEDIDDEEMEPLSLSDDDSAEEVEKEAKKKKNNRKIERNENCGPERKSKPDSPSCEIEISHDKKTEDDDSGVTTRRSQRRKTRLRPENAEECDLRAEIVNVVVKIEEKEEADVDEVVAEDDNVDAESVTSELDSLTSGSTLTTRSANRRGAKRSFGGKKSSNKRTGKSGQMSGKNKSKSGSTNSNQSKGKSRRIIFKKSSTKAPNAVARAVTSDRIFYKGQFFTRGDIVSVTDVDGGTFYAQLRGFLTDQYCEKSCVITWLLPTTSSPDPEECFDPATYVVGPEEEFPRRLDYFTFVMHAPDDYFYYRNAPYPTETVCPDQEYVLTRLGPKVRLINSAGKTIFSDA